MEYLSNIVKDINFTHFYSSEEYGKCVADYLKIKNVIVDLERKKYDISASKIRNNIENNKKYLNPVVYEDLIKNIISLK